MNYLIDTNILSELLRPAPNRGVLMWAAGQPMVGISAVTVEEAIYGLTRKANRRLIDGFEARIAEQCLVFPVTETIARCAGALRGQFSVRGIVRDQADMLIAATAQVHQLTLVTRNTRDFEGCGIGLLNPFGADAP
ncbi:MAG: type II toxin-antitoxin system VapC family toxin [Candidatus Contendobacter sp.]|nr:type II toxin-antitoxin system VapC family toxin [Candidatus Contendobacter sp.]MDG4556315.1 type II toxin-antitoxin system VapC family toxin [Candidatus Contendobacter sp.]